MNHSKPPPSPTWRKPAGMFIILTMIAVLAGIVASQSHLIGRLPIWVQAIVYLILGTVWIAPLRPLLIWMETGKWRE
ncbi:MAG: DUF2842 domain-containing protein [Sphingomonadales bacterium]|jgi:hypothetical protein|nr:DUF2842 domain-containing protein [Sphingomonadales bacterium]MBK9003381.1 DUF2842 domain-containing protein [Sphingomonadales bacterium]MBK9268632.1 DUF2842 domain-containing protein [Sphingomonadales bacterium]MBP6434515.1 DUF2842 domain-containing protein [Sphingorhabdus sp.]